jgi:hypothetical protein
VERDYGPAVQGAASFHITRWTIVMRAAQSQAPGGESAFAQLCRNYWYPLEALNVFLDSVNSRAPLSYEEVANANRLQVSTGAVKTLIHRLRKRYTALLREEVGRTVSDPAEIDEEIHALCEALVASEGRLAP